MESRLTIRIKKRPQPIWLLRFIIILPFCFGTIDYILKLPYAIRYLLDVAWVLLTVMAVVSGCLIRTRSVKHLLVWIILFLLVTVLVYIVQFQSGLYFLWGFRNNFRFYAAFFSFAIFLRQEDIQEILNLFDKLFWLNAIVSVVQYFVYGMNWDNLGGLFGAESGVNGYTNIFFLFVTAKDIVLYLEKKEKIRNCIAKCTIALAVAAMAEIKFFFVEFLIVVFLAAILTNFTWRKLGVAVGGVVGVSLCAALLVIIFPQSEGFLSIDWFRETATSDKGYTSSGDLNRLTAIAKSNELWLTNWGQRLFGLGLGNCDTSSYALVNTPFYEQYGHMHYTWMSYAIMYLECGWIGLIFYFGFFVLVYLAIERIEKRADASIKSYCRISKIMAICCVLISVYNSSLRAESGYMAYFVLAIPFALAREKDTYMIKRRSCDQANS